MGCLKSTDASSLLIERVRMVRPRCRLPLLDGVMRYVGFAFPW